MAKSRSQAAAFDIMAGLGAPSPEPPEPAASARKPSEERSRGASGPSGAEGRPKAAKPRSKARSGSVPSERPLIARNALLFEDQLRPLALLEIDTGESRSELIRRLLDEELRRKGYA